MGYPLTVYQHQAGGMGVKISSGVTTIPLLFFREFPAKINFCGKAGRQEERITSCIVSKMAPLSVRLSAYLGVCLSVTLPPRKFIPTHFPHFEEFAEFRLHALPTLGEKRIGALPRVPLTKKEAQAALLDQPERDEIQELKLLRDLDSVSAGIIMNLELARELVRSALTILQGERLAQVTLAKILSGARFGYYLNGVLVPTQCPNTYRRVRGGRVDSFAHLLRCSGLQNKIKEGPASVDFLLLMARRTIPPMPRQARPAHIHP